MSYVISEKPSVEELVNAYTKFQQSGCSNDWYALASKNDEALYYSTQPQYDKKSFAKLIDSIELNGLTNFNMTTFIGNIENWLSDDTWGNTDVSGFKLSSSSSSISKNAFDSFTSAFNCTSVGCIAGFAVANAVNWVQPKWMKEDSRNYLHFFESVACNWLNIPMEVGRRIFYGEAGSIWSFVRFNEPQNYKSINYSSLDDLCDSDNGDDWEYWIDESEIDLSTINYKYATDVLRRIISGEIVFKERDGFAPSYSNVK